MHSIVKADRGKVLLLRPSCGDGFIMKKKKKKKRKMNESENDTSFNSSSPYSEVRGSNSLPPSVQNYREMENHINKFCASDISSLYSSAKSGTSDSVLCNQDIQIWQKVQNKKKKKKKRKRVNSGNDSYCISSSWDALLHDTKGDDVPKIEKYDYCLENRENGNVMNDVIPGTSVPSLCQNYSDSYIRFINAKKELSTPAKKKLYKPSKESCSLSHLIESSDVSKSDYSLIDNAENVYSLGEGFCGKYDAKFQNSKTKEFKKTICKKRKIKRSLWESSGEIDHRDDINTGNSEIENNLVLGDEIISESNFASCGTRKKKKNSVGSSSFGAGKINEDFLCSSSKRNLMNVTTGHRSESIQIDNDKFKQKFQNTSLQNNEDVETGVRKAKTKRNGMGSSRGKDHSEDICRSYHIYDSDIENNLVVVDETENFPERNVTTCESPKKKKKKSIRSSVDAKKIVDNTFLNVEKRKYCTQTDSTKLLNVSLSGISASLQSNEAIKIISSRENKIEADLTKKFSESSDTSKGTKNSVNLLSSDASLYSKNINISRRRKVKKKAKLINSTCKNGKHTKDIETCAYNEIISSEGKSVSSKCSTKDLDCLVEIAKFQDTKESEPDMKMNKKYLIESSPRKKRKKLENHDTAKANYADFQNEISQRKSGRASSKISTSKTQKSILEELRISASDDDSLDSLFASDDELCSSRQDSSNSKEVTTDYDDTLKQVIADQRDSKHTIEDVQHLMIVVNHEIPPLHLVDVSPFLMPKKDIKTQLISLGMREGHFSKFEDTILMANWEKFTEEYGIVDSHIFLNMKSTNELDLLRRDFLLYLGNGLPQRTLFQIYQRFAHICQCSRKGPFTKEEDKIILKVLHMNIDKPYKVLAEVLKRARHSIYKRYIFLKAGNLEREERQKWSPSLAESMVKALIEVMNASHVNDLKDIKIPRSTWRNVEKKIGVPYRKLCQFWNYKLHTQLFAEKPLSEEFVYREIIKWLHAEKPTCPQDIKWNRSTYLVSGSTPWFMWEMFRRIRRTYNADAYKSLQDFIEALYKNKSIFDDKMRYLSRYEVENDNSLTLIYDGK